MKATVYLPDDLYDAAKEAELNISGATQECIRKKLAMLEAAAKHDADMERIEVEVGEGSTAYAAAFVGKWLVAPDVDESRPASSPWDPGAYYGIALTRRHRIAVYVAHVSERWPAALDDYDSLDDAEDDVPPELLAMAARELGDDRPVLLDI